VSEEVRSEPQHLTDQIGSMVNEFDKLQKLNRRRIDEARQVEQTFHQLCQKFHAEKNEWKNEQIRMNNIEHDNGRLAKQLGHLTKQYQRLQGNHDKLLEKSKQLESRAEEQETIIEHMREIVFNDTSEDANLRRTALMELQQTTQSKLSEYTDDDDDELNRADTSDKSSSTDHHSDAAESDLNQAYGEYFTGSRALARASREYQPARDYPIPSGLVQTNQSPVKPPRPPPQFIQKARGSPLKSSLRLTPTKATKKKCTFENEDASILLETSGSVYQTPKMQMIEASDLIPTELVLYVSALQNKLDHPSLYIKTPDTDELTTIDNIKRTIRSGDYDGDRVLIELDQQSATVLCQLVKEFFLDQADKLLIGGDELFENMMQSVRCCNDQYLQSLIKSLPKSKQAQLAFLVIHLQSAVEAGRLTGELACCFGAVVVGEGAPRNKNDPKELLQKMIELPGIFWRGLVSAESVNAANCSMLGPVDKSESTEWKNLIKEKQKKLLQKLDTGKFFKAPKL